MEIVKILNQQNAILFLFLFSRLSGLFAFFPIFSQQNIPMSVKSSFLFYLTVILFPFAHMAELPINITTIALGVLGEFMLGLIASLSLQLVYSALLLAGVQISFVMGFSMASVMDPQTGVSTPIISQFLGLLATMLILAFDGHHLMLLFFSKSVGSLDLGSFYPKYNMWTYLSNAVNDMFILGFILSFPVKAFSLLSDIIFGMLMKTMPQFNLLVVGFPIKIFISFAIMIVVLSSILIIFKREFLEAMRYILNWY